MATPEKDAAVSAKHPGRNLALCSLGLNLLLTLVKFLLYLLTGSAAILAETVHSLTDVVGTSLVIGGIHLSGKKSAQFPWGLYKAENLAALFSAGLILLSAYEIGRIIFQPEAVGMKHLDVTLVMLLCMAVPIFFFSRHERRRALELNSPSLLADAENWRTDLAPLAIVVAGLVGARFSYGLFDRVAAFIILLLVLKAGYRIARDAVRSLLDATIDKTTLDQMSAIIGSFPEVAEIVAVRARNSGRYVFADIEVRIALKGLREAHNVADRIEVELRRRLPIVEKVTVHYEPAVKDRLRHAAMLDDRDGRLSAHFGAAPWIALWDARAADGMVIALEIIQNPCAAAPRSKGIRLAEFLTGKEVDVLYASEDFAGRGPAYVFADAGIVVRATEAENLDELMIISGENGPGAVDFQQK